MAEVPQGFAPFAERMAREGLPDIAIRTFAHYYAQLRSGETGLVPEAQVRTVENLPDAEAFPLELSQTGQAALRHTVVIKLNGGLGTSMGLERAKSLLKVKDGLTFLDVIARQAVHSGVPLVLMNSYNTREDSLAVLRNYPELQGQVPMDFLQHKVPKVLQEDLSPAVWPANPSLEWCPPGHGDIYTALLTSGMLEALLKAGYVHAFVSNSDNLGAVLDLSILGYFAGHKLPFMMEVTDRTEADRKGGPLVRTLDGRFMLWESAMCPQDDQAAFQDVARYRYFNTNNLWINLAALRAEMLSDEGILGLPIIRSSKTVDPRNSRSPSVYQLETAMGAAIGIFEGAEAIRVPRSRFAPVKTTDDLLAVRSDAYMLTGDFRIVPHPDRALGTPIVLLDPRYYRLIDEMEARFPYGPPSLLNCAKVEVRGDIKFGRNVTVQGVVKLTNAAGRQVEIQEGSSFSGSDDSEFFVLP